MASRNITDFGEKIGGAKKDTWKKCGLSKADIEDMELLEYADYVTKENIWPTPDYSQFLGRMEKPCIYKMKRVRDSMRSKITLLGDDRNKERAEFMMEFMQHVKRCCLETKTTGQIESLNERVSQFLLQEPYIRNGGAKSSLYLFMDNTDFPGYESKLITELTLKGQLHIDDLNDACEILNFPMEYNADLRAIKVRRTYQGKFYIASTSKTSKVAMPRNEFDTKEEAIKFIKTDFAEVIAESKKKKKVSELVEVVRPQLEFVDRVGPNLRNNRNASGEHLIQMFKYRGGEFGNWNNQDDRQACLNYAFDAMADLAFATNLSLSFMSLPFNENRDRD